MEPVKPNRNQAIDELMCLLDALIKRNKTWKCRVREVGDDTIIVTLMLPLRYRDAIMDHNLSITSLTVAGQDYLNNNFSMMENKFIQHIEEQRFKEKMAVDRRKAKHQKAKKRRR